LRTLRTNLSFGVLLCLAIPLAGQNAKYPEHWFTPVSEVNKPDWEILPQAAGPGEVILSKRNELGILSNFAATLNAPIPERPRAGLFRL